MKAGGVTVCEFWTGRIGLDSFVDDMGNPTEWLTLERISNDKGYSRKLKMVHLVFQRVNKSNRIIYRAKPKNN